MGDVYRIEIPISIKDNTDPGVSQAKSKLNAFDKASQRTQERLEQMNKTKYQIVLDALDRASSIVGKVSSKARSIAGKTFSFTMKVIDLATAPLRSLWNFATSIQGAILGATGAFAGIYKPMDIAADFEQTQIAFETMLKSAEKAQQFLKEASEFANKTPFEFPELINSSKLLMAFGFEADKVLDMLKTIGDTASGLGAGSKGIDRITRALGQMQAKGRAQTEELLQLQELGVPANQILQEELGLTGEQIANIGKESIEAAKVIDALLRGMDKRFGGMMDNQSRTAKGMISTLKDTLQNSLLRPWGQGLWEGVKPGLEKITTWIDENQDIIAQWGEAWKKAGANISKWVMARVDALRNSIQRMVNSQEWKDAKNFGEKLKIAWDKIIAQPFNEWWNSTGKAWLADKASKIGEGIGTALSAGLLAILGIDARGAVEDGTSIGASFAEGFTRGFDGKKVGEAILNAIKGVFKDAGTLLPGGEKPSSTSWLSAGAIGLGIAKIWPLLTGIFKLGTGVFKLGSKAGKGLFNLFGKGSKDGVPAATGSLVPDSFITSTMAVTASVVYINGPTIGEGGSGGKIINNIPSLPGGGPATIPKLPGGGSPLALPGAAGAAGNAINTVKLANGTYVASGGALTTGLAKLGVALGSGATTAGGAAAAGAAGIAGIIGGILGLGSAGIDVYQGIKASKAGNNKVAKDEYVTAGTKAGMVGTGALIGTAIMPGLGTLIGAGIGGAAALLTGDKAGKALSDATDKDGALSKFWENTKIWASNTWDSIKTGASNAGSWISDKWSGFSEWFETSIWTPTKDVGISAINIAAGAWSEARDWIGDKWSDFSGWFDESIWTPVSNAAQAAGQWVSERWSEARTWIGERWSDFSTWFEESIWTPVKTGAQAAGQWVSERWSEAKTWVSETWGAVSGWFDESVWQPVKSAAQTAGAWLGDQFTAAKNAISEAWSGVSGWFEQKVWEPIKTGATRAWEWVGEKLGGIGEWIGDKWQSFKDWLGGLGQKGSKETGLTTSQGKGSVLEHAYGGIMTKPHMGIVAEDGAEGIIPLSPSKRQRGLDLWQRTGELLGVRAYEDGGIVGEEPDEIPVASATGKAGQNITIKVEVKAEPKFTIEGGGDNTDENKVVAILKAYIREMTDDIGDELAERLARIFANMPVKGVAEA
ncbi:tape measure protein [Tepidanaerobacter syntrophicus]|uniref:Tape measure domain-containing protein n=1 Tax=Tepidanaerobacter syntrophicus TaxID=224999 RepID=A0A0U9I4A4_9FIRM|nr:tape measure domain-containing protein [Tepidanaerobacter syntrophicus]